MRAIVIAPAIPAHRGRVVEIESAGMVEGELDDGSDAYEGYWTTPVLDTVDAPGVPWLYSRECFAVLPPESEVEATDQAGMDEARTVLNFIREFA